MAILLRVAGIPARIATGFVLSVNNFDDRTQNYIVRGHDAYAWVEVYFPDYGWVDFDPTPGTSADEALASIAGGVGGGRRIAAQRLTTPRFDLRPGVGGTNLADVVLDDILQYLAAGTLPGENPQFEQGPSKWYWLGPRHRGFDFRRHGPVALADLADFVTGTGADGPALGVDGAIGSLDWRPGGSFDDTAGARSADRRDARAWRPGP